MYVANSHCLTRATYASKINLRSPFNLISKDRSRSQRWRGNGIQPVYDSWPSCLTYTFNRDEAVVAQYHTSTSIDVNRSESTSSTFDNRMPPIVTHLSRIDPASTSTLGMTASRVYVLLTFSSTLLILSEQSTLLQKATNLVKATRMRSIAPREYAIHSSQHENRPFSIS